MISDIRYALRALRKSPGFTLVAFVTLALGIGANVAVFGVLNALVLHPLEVSDPDNLYQVRRQTWMTGKLLTHSYPAFEDYRERNVTFSGMAGIYAYSVAKLVRGNAVVRAEGDEVTGNYFDLLGVQPRAGRLFHETDGSAPYLVLSDQLWRRAFAADPDIVGATVDLNRHPFTVIGIAPARFHGTERFVWPDYWIPMVDRERNRKSIRVTIIGRLKRGVTPAQATENLGAISAQLAKQYPETDDGQPPRLIHPGLFGDEGEVIRGFLYGVTVLALLVLAAACANLATLFAARAADRGRELALRVALGSSRGRLLRQLLTEALVVSLLGGAAGVAGADLLLGALNRWRPDFGGHLDVNADARVYLAGLVLTLGSALAFGMAPARRAWHSSPMQAIRGGTSESPHLRRFAARDLLLGAQIAVCTLLVTASLVAVRGMVRTLHVPLGFRPEGALLVEMDLSETERPADGGKALIDLIRGVPGVTAAGAVNRTPMTGGLRGVPIFRPGTTDFRLNNSALAAYVFQMSPGYLEAAGTRLLSGRDFSWHDTPLTPPVAIVNQTFARRMWGHETAVGQRFVVGGALTEVAGLVEDGKYHDIEESPQPVAYLALTQSEQNEAIFVVRSARPAGEMAAALRSAVKGLDPAGTVAVQSWSEGLESELFPARAAAAALGAMGVLAAMLAMTGIFGMSAYSVSRRMRELGIRVALGAPRAQVVMAALARPLVLLGAGSVVGVTAGILASGLLGEIVYQADPGDPAVLAGTVLTMALLGMAASAVPARRALSVDPALLMREE